MASKLVGVAFTVRTRPGDNLAIHRALELVGPGDVIVVDGGGDETRALVGEIMKNIAEYRGAAGYVIDGAIRDVASFAASDFPCFARTAIQCAFSISSSRTHAVRMLADGVDQQPALFESDVAGRRANQPAQRRASPCTRSCRSG